MAYWVYLERDGESVAVPRFTAGGTYALGGSALAELNVTYNYSALFAETLDSELGLRWLHQKPAGDCVTRLREAVGKLGTETSSGYWAPTRGNAGAALAVLLWWAALHPDAVFRVS
jgi:hypothetical protein